VRGRHLECFLRLAEEAGGSEEARRLERLETEHDNLRAALEWSRAAEDRVETGLRLAQALWVFWDLRHHSREAREYLTALLERSGSVPPAMRAHALCQAGHFINRQEDFRSARQMVEEALAIFRRLEDPKGIALALQRLGVITMGQGDKASARALLEESLGLYQELRDRGELRDMDQDPWLLYQLGSPGWLLWHLGRVSWAEGDTSSARARFEQSLAVFRANGPKTGMALALMSLGRLAADDGEYPSRSLFELFEEMLEIGEELGSEGTVAASLHNLGDVARWQGEYEVARSRYVQSLAMVRELDYSGLIADHIASSLVGLGLALVRLGEHAEARSAACESLRIRQERGNKHGITRCLECLAQAAWVQGEPERMARLFGAAEALREANHWKLHPRDRSDYDGVAPARAALGEEMFAAAWVEGRAMSLEDAIAYALEDPSPSEAE
jgi:tetratricopeptide (TPR) repeat protein